MFWPQIRPHVIHGAVYAMQLHDVLALDFNGEEEEKCHTGSCATGWDGTGRYCRTSLYFCVLFHWCL